MNPARCMRGLPTLSTLRPAATMTALLRDMPPVILGSSSIFRRRIMDEISKDMGITYSVMTADIDEKPIRHEDPEKLVMLLANAKADAILTKMAPQKAKKGLLITCDQVVTFRGQIREKPEDESQCRQFIREYSDSPDPTCTVSGVLVTDLASGSRNGCVDIAKIYFKEISREVEDAVIADGEVLWCAGGLQAEHPAVTPCIARQEGSMDSVMGLPKDVLMQLIQKSLN